MDYFVIGDNDTVLGCKFAGIPGQAVQDPGEAREVFRQAVKDRGISVIKQLWTWWGNSWKMKMPK